MAITPTDFTFAQEISGASPLADNGGQVLLVTGDCLSPLFWDEVKDGGGDIRVCTDAEGLNEIPAFPFKCVKGSTELLLFCRLPAYTNSSKTVFIFAGNPALSQYALSDTYGRYNTLQDYDFFAPDALTDLTVNAHAVTPTDITSDTVLLGVDTATFNGTSSYISNATNAISNAANRQITICAWVKPENLTGQTTVGSAYGFIRYNGLFLDTAIGKNNYVDWRSGAGSKVTTTSTYTTSAWNHVSGGRIADNERFATVNGAYDSATQSSRVMQGSVNFRWGDNSYKHNTPYDGRMAFLSIYDSAARTESELDTEYANQSDPALFWTKSNSWNPSRNYDNTTNTLDATHPLFANAVTGFHSRDEIAGTSMVDVATQAGATFSDSFTKNPDGSVTGTGLGNTGGTSNYATVANNPSGANAFAHSIMFFVDVDIAASASNNKAGLFCKIENSQLGGNDFTFEHYNWSDEWRGSIRSAFNTRKFYNESDDVGRNQFVMVYTPSGRKADIYRNGVLFHTLTFTDGTDTGNPWNQTKLGLGKEADKFYSSLLLDKDGDFTQQEIDDFVKDPYAMFEVAGGGGVIDLTSETSEGLNESAEFEATVLLQLVSETSEGLNESAEFEATVLLQLVSETSEGLNESAEFEATVLLQLVSETSEGLNESAEFEATDESVITLIAQTSEGLNESAEHQATVLLQLASETSEGLNESAEHQATVLLQLASETSEGLNESAEFEATVLLQLASETSEGLNESAEFEATVLLQLVSETSEGLNESAEFEATDESVITLIAQTSEGLNESAEHQATVLLQLASETSEGLNESAEHQATVLLQLASETSEGLNESADFVVNVLYNLVVLFSQTLNESAIFNVEETGSPDFVAQTSETISQSGVFNVKYIRVDKTLSNLFLIRLED